MPGSDSGVERLRRIFEVRQVRQVGLIAQFVEGDEGAVGQHQVAADDEAQAPTQRPVL